MGTVNTGVAPELKAVGQEIWLSTLDCIGGSDIVTWQRRKMVRQVSIVIGVNLAASK